MFIMLYYVILLYNGIYYVIICYAICYSRAAGAAAAFRKLCLSENNFVSVTTNTRNTNTQHNKQTNIK